MTRRGVLVNSDKGRYRVEFNRVGAMIHANLLVGGIIGAHSKFNEDDEFELINTALRWAREHKLALENMASLFMVAACELYTKEGINMDRFDLTEYMALVGDFNIIRARIPEGIQ